MTASDAHSGRGSGPLSGVWYFLVTTGSFGLLAWVPFAHAAARLRSRVHAVQASVYAALASLVIVLFAIAPIDADGNTVGIGSAEVGIALVTLVGLMAAGVSQQIPMRRTAYELPGGAQHVRRRRAPVDPAIARVLDARARRAKSREIAAKDPLMAHELRIGRPELTRDYDDGGLVDLNAATAKSVAKLCEVPPDVARAIVEARTTTGGFVSVEDVFGLVDIPLAAWSVVRDRAVVVRLV
jgi:hypothetical protein